MTRDTHLDVIGRKRVKKGTLFQVDVYDDWVKHTQACSRCATAMCRSTFACSSEGQSKLKATADCLLRHAAQHGERLKECSSCSDIVYIFSTHEGHRHKALPQYFTTSTLTTPKTGIASEI
eukprot:1155918-Pelagomonas_calceolata.AAC.4